MNASCDASALAGHHVHPEPHQSSDGDPRFASAAHCKHQRAQHRGTPGTYNININTHDTTGAPRHSFTIALTIPTPDFSLSAGSFPIVNAGSGTTSGTISVAALNGFTGTVSLTCSLKSGNGGCSVAPASVSSFPATANVTINATALGAGSYQASVQGVSGSLTHTLTIPFNVGDYQLSGPQTLSLPPGGQGTPALTFTASTYYTGLVNASCDASALAGTICTLSPANPLTVSTGAQVPLTATIDVTNDAVAGTYSIKINTQDTTGSPQPQSHDRGHGRSRLRHQFHNHQRKP